MSFHTKNEIFENEKNTSISAFEVDVMLSVIRMMEGYMQLTHFSNLAHSVLKIPAIYPDIRLAILDSLRFFPFYVFPSLNYKEFGNSSTYYKKSETLFFSIGHQSLACFFSIFISKTFSWLRANTN